MLDSSWYWHFDPGCRVTLCEFILSVHKTLHYRGDMSFFQFRAFFGLILDSEHCHLFCAFWDVAVWFRSSSLLSSLFNEAVRGIPRLMLHRWGGETEWPVLAVRSSRCPSRCRCSWVCGQSTGWPGFLDKPMKQICTYIMIDIRHGWHTWYNVW